MGTLSGLVNLTRSTLLSDQAALNATANNVANQDTAGYTRQVVSWQTGDSVTLSQGVQSSSAPTVTTTSVRDRVLEQRVQQATQAEASTSSQADVLSQIETIFGVTGSSTTAGSTALGTSLNAFFSSLTALAVNPADAATRQGVLSAANSFASNFNGAETQLASISSDLNGGIATSTSVVNGLTATIAGLNQQIRALNPSADAGTLEDQRQLAITQLSQYIGLDQSSTERNGITLTTTGGALLVSDSRSFSLTAGTALGVATLTDSFGNDVTSTITGGSIGGQLAAQQSAVPNVTQALGALAQRLVTAINTQNEAGVDQNGLPGAALLGITFATDGTAKLSVLATSGTAVAAAGTGEGSAGNTNANALAALATGLDGNGFTPSGQLASLLAAVGTSSASLGELNTAQQASLTQATSARDSFSAVSLDEEAANLTQYQRAYQAAAKLFSILDTLMAAAINLGSETTVN